MSEKNVITFVLAAVFFSSFCVADEVLHLNMDETSWNGTADEVIDSSGYGNHGTSVNGATTATGGKAGRTGDFTATPKMLSGMNMKPGTTLNRLVIRRAGKSGEKGKIIIRIKLGII